MDSCVGKTIFAINYIAAGKTVSLAAGNEALLKERFFPGMTDSALKLSIFTCADHLKGCELFDTTDGFYSALWNMAEGFGCGLEIDIRKVPVAQETVEIFEYFDLDPYSEPSEGTYIAVTNRPDNLSAYLEKNGTVFAMIGFLTKGPARIIKNAGRIRYLDRSRNDKEVTEAEKKS